MAKLKKSKDTYKNFTVYIDGAGHVLGRLSSHVAKMALMGEKIAILNSEKIVITGSRDFIIKNYLTRMRDIGGRDKGPFWPKRPDEIVRRAVKRMLPYKRKRGSDAYGNILTFVGIPKEFESVTSIEIPKAKISPKEIRFITVGELSKRAGGKW